MEVEIEVFATTEKFVENLLHVRRQNLEKKKKHSFFYMLPKQEMITFGF
jgi:adenylate cyclase class IV